MLARRVCTLCGGKKCGFCRGKGTETHPTEEEENQVLGDVLRGLNDDGVSREPFEVIEGGKLDK